MSIFCLSPACTAQCMDPYGMRSMCVQQFHLSESEWQPSSDNDSSSSSWESAPEKLPEPPPKYSLSLSSLPRTRVFSRSLCISVSLSLSVCLSSSASLVHHNHPFLHHQSFSVVIIVIAYLSTTPPSHHPRCVSLDARMLARNRCSKSPLVLPPKVQPLDIVFDISPAICGHICVLSLAIRMHTRMVMHIFL